MSLRTRVHPEGTTAEELREQWERPCPETGRGSGRVILLRTMLEDPRGIDHVTPLLPPTSIADNLIDLAWADAQLAADMTILGRATGLRVALVPENERFYADLIGLPKRSRLRLGRGSRNPVVALRSVRRQLVATIVAETAAAPSGSPQELRILGPSLFTSPATVPADDAKSLPSVDRTLAQFNGETHTQETLAPKRLYESRKADVDSSVVQDVRRLHQRNVLVGQELRVDDVEVDSIWPKVNVPVDLAADSFVVEDEQSRPHAAAPNPRGKVR